MIFNRLWRAQRRAKRKSAELRAKYAPLIQAAKIAKDSNEVASLENDWYTDLLFNDEYDVIQTDRLVRRAQKLDIPIPPKKNPTAPDFQEDENWHFNEATGNYTLSAEARRGLLADIRKEENERLSHGTRWVTQVIVPIMSLLIALISLLLTLRRK